MNTAGCDRRNSQVYPFKVKLNYYYQGLFIIMGGLGQ